MDKLDFEYVMHAYGHIEDGNNIDLPKVMLEQYCKTFKHSNATILDTKLPQKLKDRTRLRYCVLISTSVNIVEQYGVNHELFS